MNILFPPIEPYSTAMLPVSSLHTLYYEQCGNPDGFPVVFLHGGPGGSAGPECRRFFDPAFYRIVLLDQRGAGRSTPFAETRENTTWDLVEDLERLRNRLGIQRWLVFGGSWGSTLALCYAIRHPAKTAGLVLRGVYLGRRWENYWLFHTGASCFYPDKWGEFIHLIPPEERGDLPVAYHKRLMDPDAAVHMPAAERWSNWEGTLVHLDPKPADEKAENQTFNPLAIARFECHYIVNGMFFPRDNFILENTSALAGIPIHIVHGRYDVVCPPLNAWELSQRLPHARLDIVQLGGHTPYEPAMTSALVDATEQMKGLVNPGR